MTHKEKLKNLGKHSPKVALLCRPPGTGKTLLGRTCANQTKSSSLLKLAGPQLVQMFISEGAKLPSDAIALVNEKAPAILFIDEIDYHSHQTARIRKTWRSQSPTYNVRAIERMKISWMPYKK